MDYNTWRYVDCRHQKNGQIRIFNPAGQHVANILASHPNALEIAVFVVGACNISRDAAERIGGREQGAGAA